MVVVMMVGVMVVEEENVSEANTFESEASKLSEQTRVLGARRALKSQYTN